MNARRVLVNRCDLNEGHKGLHLDHVLLVSWNDDECEPECKPHAAAPMPREFTENPLSVENVAKICGFGTITRPKL